jgi:hypothetical protein
MSLPDSSSNTGAALMNGGGTRISGFARCLGLATQCRL